MSSAQLLKRSPITKNEAAEEFDRLFDKYIALTTPQPVLFHSQSVKTAAYGKVQLESGGQTEHDEVYADSASLPEQEDSINEVARELVKLGDQYNKQFEQEMKGPADNMVSTLTTVFTQVAKLEYRTFENTMRSLPLDRNAANFVIVMNISSKVIGNVGSAANKAKNYFRRFIGEQYSEPFAEAGGVRQYVGHPT